MYRCEQCNSLSQPNEKQSRKVVETRQVEYRKEPGNTLSPIVGQGTEIVREVKVCGKCNLKE